MVGNCKEIRQLGQEKCRFAEKGKVPYTLKARQSAGCFIIRCLKYIPISGLKCYRIVTVSPYRRYLWKTFGATNTDMCNKRGIAEPFDPTAAQRHKPALFKRRWQCDFHNPTLALCFCKKVPKREAPVEHRQDPTGVEAGHRLTKSSIWQQIIDVN